MFDFLDMAGNYESRKVAWYDDAVLMVSTTRVTDGRQPYETAVQHERYGPHMVIVEAYDTREEVEKGHAVWVERMTAEDLPKKLHDCGNSAIAAFGQDLFGEDAFDIELDSWDD